MWDWEMMVFMDRIHFLVPEFIFTCSGGITRGGGGFMIDPITEKDLYDVLHAKHLPYVRFQMGIHIANFSHFIKTKYYVDNETQYRAARVCLMYHIGPMFPRPMYNISRILNENINRLEFS